MTLTPLLTFDDYESYEEDEPDADFVWVEYKTRALVDMSGPKPIRQAIKEAYHTELQTFASIGEPVKCNHCGFTAIETAMYPHGTLELINDLVGLETTNPVTVYCPHCDGGEDA